MGIDKSPSLVADPHFSIAVWVRGSPTPGTSTIIADATGPGFDATDPPDARIVVCGANQHGGIITSGGPALLLFARGGGTSVVLQPWFYDSTLVAWVKFGATSTITLATSDLAVIATRNLGGAKFYVQVVTVTGTITEAGYDFA